MVDIDQDDQIMNVLYNLKDRFQVPGRQYLGSGRTYERDGIESAIRAGRSSSRARISFSTRP